MRQQMRTIEQNEELLDKRKMFTRKGLLVHKISLI